MTDSAWNPMRQQFDAPPVTLAEFLLARIAEDEAVARAATSGQWFRETASDDAFPQGDESVMASHGVWRTCPHFCVWSANLETHRGTPGVPGHEHLETELVVGSWGHDADGVIMEPENEKHILAWQPARVLAECEAKRRIAEEHQVTRRDPRYEYVSDAPCITCGQVRPRKYPCATLRALALPYADHPDYREEWK